MSFLKSILLYFSFLITSFAQGQITIDEFLGSSSLDPALQTLSNQESFLSTKSYRLAPIRKLAFQTKFNQLDRTREGFAFRILPSNPWEVRNTNQYFKTYEELIRVDRERTLRESLRLRYNLIIDWLYLEETHQLKEEEKLNTDKLLAILEAQRFSDYFNAETYVALKLEQVDNTLELEETNFDIDMQRRKVEALYEAVKFKKIDWTASSVLTVEKVESLLNSTGQDGNGKNSEVAYREKQIELAMRKWQLEKSNFNVGFIQTEYEGFQIENNRRPWSISLGVTIPLFNPNKGDMALRKLQVIDAQGNFEASKIEQQKGREYSYEKIKSLLKRYKEVNAMMESLNFSTLTTTLQQIKGNNPATVVKMQNNNLKLRSLSTRLKRDILTAYIEFLGYSDMLQQQPLVNYLSPTFNEIGNR